VATATATEPEVNEPVKAEDVHMKHWRAMAQPPVTALKEIKGGRLQGMTDVNPQWRYQAMTEQFGPCGDGWKYEIDKIWTEPGCDGEILGFAQVSVRYRIPTLGEWSDPIVGVGGNHLITKEKNGLRNNDECWKMAVTDALSVALKMLGVAADIYAGKWDGSKYAEGSGADADSESGTLALPDGYAEFAVDFLASAEEGLDALRKAFKDAHTNTPEFTAFLTKHDNARYEKAKARAAAVDKAKKKAAA
jgi:hypothetical protein